MGIEAPGFIHCLHLKNIDNEQQAFTDEGMKDYFRKTFSEKENLMTGRSTPQYSAFHYRNSHRF